MDFMHIVLQKFNLNALLFNFLGATQPATAIMELACYITESVFCEKPIYLNNLDISMDEFLGDLKTFLFEAISTLF